MIGKNSTAFNYRKKCWLKKNVFTNTARSPICYLIEETRDGKKKKKVLGKAFGQSVYVTIMETEYIHRFLL